MKLMSIISVVLFSASVFAGDKGCMDDSKFADMSKMELDKVLVSQKATIIDVNTESSFKKSRIPGAVHYGTNKKNFAKVLPKDKNAMIVAYCGGKQCTAWKAAARAACEMGYKNIRHFSEGIRGWDKSKRG